MDKSLCKAEGGRVEGFVIERDSIEKYHTLQAEEIASLREELADARRVIEYLWTNRGVRILDSDTQRVLRAAGIDPFKEGES